MSKAIRPFLHVICGVLLCSILSSTHAEDGRAYLRGPSLSGEILAAIGFSASYDQLAKLKMPGIVYLEHRKNEHFSVLRGIDESTVWLADPSLGNRTYSRWQFLDMWDTRTGATENAELKGKILLVFPADGKARSPSDFFTKTPRRQTALAVRRLRALPETQASMR